MKTVVIIGAGPAGLTAALEVLEKTDYRPIVLEATGELGGISRTVQYRGNRMDIGGHRFFSRSDRVMDWWQRLLPLQGAPSCDDLEDGRVLPWSTRPGAPSPETEDLVMLLRRRVSRILYRRRFFDYPVSLNVRTARDLGPVAMGRIGLSYLHARAFPRRQEKTLEDFFVNRFGDELYRTFFKSYTEKVWGVPCDQISAEWGAQRIKGLSITKTLLHAARRLLGGDLSLGQKKTETSLIEQFLYPKLGPGQLWEHVARLVEQRGGEVHLHARVTGLRLEEGRVAEVTTSDPGGASRSFRGDWILSSMPVKDLVGAMGAAAPPAVSDIAQGLRYRDFVTVGLLARRLKVRPQTRLTAVGGLIPDNWVYVQEADVQLGRVQVFNNWSPYLVADRRKVWLGLEYFATEGDSLWSLPEDAFRSLATRELAQIGFVDPADVEDSVVVKVPKAYPAYFGTYDRFGALREYLDAIPNLLLIGRNGMHRYNNQDHSMLSAMRAVEVMLGTSRRAEVWAVNAEDDYHESR